MTRPGRAMWGVARVVLIVFVCVAVRPASAEEWDAAHALSLATSLQATLGQALEAAEVAPAQETAIQQRTRDAAVVEMRRVHSESREFVTRLRIGTEREDTAPFFVQLQAAYEIAVQTARDAVPQPAVAPLLEEAESLILSLQKVYASG